MDELAVVSLQAVTQIPQIMTSTLQIAPELRQTVISEKINETIFHAIQLIHLQKYEPALKVYNQILNNLLLLSDREKRSNLLGNLMGYYDIVNVLQPLAQLPHQEQDKWIEWLLKLQQEAPNLDENPLAIAQNLQRIARVYQNLGRSELVAITLQQAITAVQQIPNLASRTEHLIQLASIWVACQQKAEAQQVLIQALAAVEQISSDDPYAQGYWFSIASLYIQMNEAQRALALADKTGSADAIRQEVVRDAIKRGDLHLAQAVTAKIQGAENQAFTLVEMAVYWATHHQPRLGNRLFAQALKRVAKEQYADSLQISLIQTYCTTGQITISLNAAQRLTQDGAKATALSEIAVVCAKANQSQQVQKILAQLTGLIGWESSLMFAAINAQQYDLAIWVFNTVKNKGDFVYKSGYYRQLVQALLRSQHLDQALQIAKQAPNDFWTEERNLSLKEIALAYANAQQWTQAIQVVTQIKNTANNPYELLTRAEIAANAPTPEEFTSLIKPAITQAQVLKSIEQKALALAAIAQAYLRFGDEEQTQSFLQQAIQTIEQVKDDESRGRLFAEITGYLINQGQYTAALTIAKAYPVFYLVESVYSAISYQLSITYKVDIALPVLEMETLPDTKATALLEIAHIYALQQRKEDAIAFLDRAFVVAQQIADPESRTITRYGDTPEPDYTDRRSQYTRLVKQYVALQQLDKAQQVVKKVQEASLRDYLQAWIDC